MRHVLVTACLWPLLYAQGRRVRRTVPKLEEAPGPRAGVTACVAADASDRAPLPPLRVLVVGDSSGAGFGAPSQDDALVGRLVATLRAHREVCWRLEAWSGATTAAMVAHLSTLAPAPFDVVVTALGVNDVLSQRLVRPWLRDVERLHTVLRDGFGVRRVLLSGIPPMGSFPGLPQPLRWYLGARAADLDRALRQWATTRDDCEHVPMQLPLDASAMAPDGFHPGLPVYAMWGAEMARRILAHAERGVHAEHAGDGEPSPHR